MNTPEQKKVLSLDSLAQGGDAVGRIETGVGSAKQVVFVPYGAPGDRVVLDRWESKRSFARAWIKEVEQASPQRADPPCPYFFKPGDDPTSVCGGCDWQHMNYASQAQAKKQLLVEAFQRIARIAKPPVDDTIAAPDPWRYRNKVQIPFANADGKLIAGFYAPGSHTIVPFADCLIQNETSVKIFTAVKEWFRQYPVKAYTDQEPEGWLRHLLIRTNSKSDALVALITKNDVFQGAVEFSEFLTKECPSVKSIFQNVNPKPGNVVLGPEWRHIFGKHFLKETISGLDFRLSPGSFFQVHHAMAEKLYERVGAFIQPDATKTVLELYAGVGAMAQLLAKNSRKVWAVEENGDAVLDGIESAKWNSISNIKFVQAKCEDALARGRFLQGPADKLGSVVLDPPRAGCDQKVLRSVIRLAPEKIVYVSCDPATLARDAKYLSTGGYHLRRSVPVDLFPQTAHVESVSLFAKPPSREKDNKAATQTGG